MPLPWFEPALIFLGALGGTAIILIVVYLCIKWDKCFCNIRMDDGDDTPDPEYTQVALDDSGTDGSGDVEAASGKLSDKPFAKSTGDLDKPMFSSDEEEMAPGVAKIGEIVSDTASGSTHQAGQEHKKKSKLSKSLESLEKHLGSLQLTLQYSKKDLFLFIVIHKITGFLPSAFPSIDNVRISMVLLPTKKNRSRTKFVSVTEEPEFGASFKFSNVSRADLFRSAMRFRLYGRHIRLGVQLGKEKLLGEITVHLADVAQRERTTTTRPFVIVRK